MKKLLTTTSNWKFILPSFLAFALCLYLFQVNQAKINAITGEESPIVDLRKDYDKAEIQEFFSLLKEEGRQIHADTTGILDMIFPLTYGSFFILLSAFFLKKIIPSESNWIYLALIPVLLMIVDYVENFNTLAMLEAFPDLDAQKVRDASRITGIKNILTYASQAIVLIPGLLYFIKWIRNRGKSS